MKALVVVVLGPVIGVLLGAYLYGYVGEIWRQWRIHRKGNPCTYRLTRVEDGYQTGGLIAGCQMRPVEEQTFPCIPPDRPPVRYEITVELCGNDEWLPGGRHHYGGFDEADDLSADE